MQMLSSTVRTVLIITALIRAPTTSASEVTLLVNFAGAAPESQAQAQVILGEFPVQDTFEAPTGFIPVTLPRECSSLGNAIPIRGKTALVLNPEVCDGQGGALRVLALLSAAQAGDLSAVLASQDESGDVREPNFGLQPTLPNELEGKQGMVFSASRNWVTSLVGLPSSTLQAARLSARMNSPTIVLGTEVKGSVLTGHIQYYKVDLKDRGDISVTVTPKFGNPDLYMIANQGAFISNYPTPRNYQVSQTSPGDDAYNWLREDLPTGSVSAMIGIYGSDKSNFTLLVSSSEDSVSLVSGESRRFELPSGVVRYFTIAVPRGEDLRLAVTPLTGDPDLYVSVEHEKPSIGGYEWSSAGANHPYEHIEIPSDDPMRCQRIAVCNFYMAVVANTATTFSIVAAVGNETAIHLVDGMPQAGFTTEARTYRKYLFRTAGTHSDLKMSLSMLYGVAHIYVSANEEASVAHHTWSSVHLSTGDESLLISSSDIKFCPSCQYHVTVASESPTSFTITASSNHSVRVLDDGSPINEIVTKGNYEYFKLFVSQPSVNILFVMSAFTGDPDLFVSTTNVRPNKTSYDFSSEDVAGDILSIPSDNPKLKDCQSRPTCVLYASVYGNTGDASFSLTASTMSTSAGFHIDAPEIIARYIQYNPSTFGNRLPDTPASDDVVYSNPHHACRTLINADNVRGKIVIIDRGPSDDIECPFPSRYFANKVAVAQDAGAVAVIMVNDRPGGRVYMGAVSGDAASQVTIPSIFISQEDGEILKSHLTGLRATLSRPRDRVPILVPGLPSIGLSQANQFVYYQILTSPGRDNITITVSPQFGNPDLYVSPWRNYGDPFPSERFYTWSSHTSGSDSISIAASDPNLCTLCVLVVGVLASGSNSHFTITTALGETLVTLAAGAPLPSQEVSANEYKFYRFYVDRANTGFTISLTVQTGDADLYVSFQSERPTKETATWAAAGRNSCPNVDCGNSIHHGDAIHIAADDHQAGHSCERWPCLAYIGVYGAENSVFTILMTESNDTPITLLDGIEQRVSLQYAGSYAYFTFFAGATVGALDIAITPTSGDPDLYVSTAATFPNRDDFQWRSTESAFDTVHITTSDPHSCSNIQDELPDQDGGSSALASAGCLYRIAVYAWTDNVDFFISVTSIASTERLLVNGLPASAAVSAGESRYFKYFVRDMADVELVLTPYVGNPSLFARFDSKPAREAARPEDQWASTERVGLDALFLSPTDSRYCRGVSTTESCTLYILVYGETNSSFSLVASSSRAGENASTSLVLGRPQAGVVTATSSKLYTYNVPRLNDGLIITLTAFSGNPVLYLSTDGSIPSPEGHYIASTSGSAPIRVPPQTELRNSSIPFMMSVFGGRHPASYSIALRTPMSTQLLQDGVPLEVQLSPHDTAHYSISVENGVVAPVLMVTALQGSVTVLVSYDGSRPDPSRYNARVIADPQNPASLPLLAGRINLIQTIPMEIKYVAPPTPQWGQCVPASMTDLSTRSDRWEMTCERLVLNAGDRCDRYFLPRPDIGGWQPCSLSQGKCGPGVAIQCGASAEGGTTTFTLLPLASSSLIPVLVDGQPQLLSVTEGGESRFRFVVDVHQSVSISAFARDNLMSTVSLSAFVGNFGSQQALRDQAVTGGVARLVVPADWVGQSCDPNCVVMISLSVSRTANVSLTAVSQRSLTQLPILTPYCDTVFGDSSQQVALLLDPVSEADDELFVDLQQCSGSAEFYVSSRPNPGPGNFDAKSTSSLLLSSSLLKGHSTIFAAVHSRGSASDFCLQARPKTTPRWTETISAADGQLHLASASGDRLELTLRPPRDGTAREYQVYLAHKSTMVRTWCGVTENSLPLRGAQMSSTTSGADETIHLSVPLPSLGQLLCSKSRHSNQTCFALEEGGEYQLTVVALVVSGSASWLVYEPIVWEPGHQESSGGSNGFAVFLKWVFWLGLIGGIVYGVIVARRRRMGPRDVVDLIRDEAVKLSTRVEQLQLAERAREISRRLRQRVQQYRRPARQVRRVRVGDGMNTPLTADTDSNAPLDFSHVPVPTGIRHGGQETFIQPLQLGNRPMTSANHEPPSGANLGMGMGMGITAAVLAAASDPQPHQDHFSSGGDNVTVLQPLTAPVYVSEDAAEDLPLASASVVPDDEIDD